MPKLQDLINQRFGLLLVTGRATNTAHGHPRWEYLCDCGSAGVTAGNNLRNGSSKSCGCVAAEKARERNTTHGHNTRAARSATYTVWSNMLQRVADASRHNYHRYGGRGITVCERWREFRNFLEDMGASPDGMEIDRENNALGYFPGNCRWLPRKTNQRNRDNNHLIEWDGRQVTVAEASEISGLHYRTLLGRLSRGWSGSELFEKARKIKPRTTS